VPCVTIEYVACVPSTDKLLPWVYPKVDCRLAFVDSGALGRGCAYSLLDEQDGHHPRLRGHGRRLHVHRQLQQLHRHDPGGDVDPICGNHFIDVSRGSNHAGYDSDYSSNVSDRADKGRQIGDADLLELLTKLFGLLVLTTSRNNNRREERRYDNRDHRHDNKSKSSRARQFCHHRPDFRPKISTLLIFYLFMV